MLLSDILDTDLLANHIAVGNVVARRHPAEPLTIYNYTAACQYERSWDHVTRACRGLIVRDDGEVVARPWAKFYNYGEDDEQVDPDEPCVVMDKTDGSLGVLYPTSNGDAVATRGSFESEQAIVATRIWREQYVEHFQWSATHTALFEIVYPGNRIVVNYGDTSDLFLLGSVEVATGAAHPGCLHETHRRSDTGWFGSKAAVMEARTFRDALSLSPRPNAEGVVVYLTDRQLKIKQDDYVALHKLITGLNEKVVWERLGAGDSAADICAEIPDEFHQWTNDVADMLRGEAATILARAHEEHQRILNVMPEGWERKDYALEAKAHPLAALLFLILDNRNVSDAVCKMVKPKFEVPLFDRDEDAA